MEDERSKKLETRLGEVLESAGKFAKEKNWMGCGIQLDLAEALVADLQIREDELKRDTGRVNDEASQ